jgi:hypothetical protein
MGSPNLFRFFGRRGLLLLFLLAALAQPKKFQGMVKNIKVVGRLQLAF